MNWLAAGLLAFAASADPVAFDVHDGATLPDVVLQDEQGRDVHSASLFAQPAFLVFAWYGCRQLCGLVLARFDRAAAALDGARLVVVSIDPADTPQSARAMRARHAGVGERHFLVGSAAAVRRIADAAGVRYFYDPMRATFAHPAGVLWIARGGVVGAHVEGVTFDAADLRALQAGSAQPASAWQRVCGLLAAPPGPRSAAVLVALRLGAVLCAVAALAAGWWRRRR